MSWNPALVADDGVKTTALERQGLAVSGYWPKRWFAQPAARAFKHRGRDVRTNDDAGGADDRSAANAASPVPVETSRTRDPGAISAAATTCRHEKARPSANPAVICRGINATTHGNVKARPETGAHCRLRSTALVEGSGVSPIMCWRGVMWQLPSGSVAFAVSRPELSDTEQTDVRREHPPK